MDKLFVAEVKKQLSLRNWKYCDLAKATGYKISTIKTFMAGRKDRNKSETVGKAIATALNIKERRD